MIRVIVFPILMMLTFAGCALVRETAPVNTVRHRFTQPPQQAASCFARNAEEHSSALVSEIRPPDARGHVEVIVSVKNGVTYATAEFQPMGAGSNGTIKLAVYSSGGNRDLVRSLVEGC
jgi:uncharacterized iron-regulated membrane protein